MMAARRKLPPYRGLVFRGVKGVDHTNAFHRHRTVTWWAFSSTTRNPETLRSDNFLGTTGLRTQFIIEAKSGVDISSYSSFRNREAEVLLFPGTMLKVKGTLEL